MTQENEREYIIEDLMEYPHEVVSALIEFVRLRFKNEIDIYCSGDDHSVVTNNHYVADFFEFLEFKVKEIRVAWF